MVGVGPVFCQGVDLLYLVNDRPEKRKEAAEELAAGEARLSSCQGCGSVFILYGSESRGFDDQN